MLSFGDILVINFPFSDNKGSKRRPVIVLKEFNDGDILIAKITSKSYSTAFDVTLNDWQSAGLLSASVVRMHKIQTIHSSLVFAHIGRLSSNDIKQVRKILLGLIMSF